METLIKIIIILAALLITAVLIIIVGCKDEIESEEYIAQSLQELGFIKVTNNIYEKITEEGYIQSVTFHKDFVSVYPGVMDKKLLKILNKRFR